MGRAAVKARLDNDEMLARFVERVRVKSPGLGEDEVIFIAEMLRGDFVRGVNDHLRLFRQERNGLSVWRAIRECVSAGEPIPDVIAQKLAAWAGNLENATNAREMARALELSGDEKNYKGAKHLNAIEKRRAIASEVELVRNLYDLNKKAACELVAKNSRGKLTFDKVQKDYFAFFKKSTRRTAGHTDLHAVMKMFRGSD
jgi:hypothetical protein